MLTRLSDLSAMKLLWFGYILLSLTIIYTSFLMMIVGGRVAPGKEGLLIPVVFFTTIGGLGSGLYRLIRLIWPFIANDPDTEPVPPKKLRLTFTWLALLLVVDGSAHYLVRYQPPIYKSEITFKDPVVAVQDSMLALRHIMATVSSNQIVGCYVRRQDSTLVFFSPKMDSAEHTFRTWGHIDTVTAANAGLRFVPPADRARLISLLRYLNRNLISGIRHDTSIGFWLYEYGVTSEDNDVWRRDLLVYDIPADTLHPAFHYYLKPHDRKQRIILVGHNRVPFVFFR